MSTLSKEFAKHSVSALVAKARHIAHSLGTPPGSGYFPATSPTAADLSAATGLLAELASREKSPTNLALRNAQRAVLIRMLQALAADLERLAAGDRVKLAATGYDINRSNARHTAPPAIAQDIRVRTTGKRGEAIVRCRKLATAAFYECCASLSPEGGPYIPGATSTSSRKGFFQGLERGKDHYFRMRGVNGTGPGPWSDIAVMMVV